MQTLNTPPHSHYLYGLMELHRANLTPMRMFAKFSKALHGHPLNPISYTMLGRSLSAGNEMLERLTRDYPKPEFGITSTMVAEKETAIVEEIILQKTFCNLLHFNKIDSRKIQPKLLIAAPMSGHYATLLRGTVEGLLPHFDVYITDWMNVRDIPVSFGEFTLDDYIDYVIEFLQKLGSETHIMAVCQPSVPVMAAVSLMSEANDPATPSSMTLIGGPIDTRKNPTEVNNFAADRTIQWFEQNLISRVPANYKGFMRLVYPGFMQLSGFMAMNMYRHVGEHIKLFQHLVDGDGESAESHKRFYNEYLAVMDLPAEFYLQTVNAVFKDFLLPRGKLESRGRRVNPNAITKTALLAIEGERDDISGVGQTKAALRLCRNLPDDKKHYHLQEGVGHYGTFNGRKFKEHIVPLITEFAQKN
jgi:poly(3-hydroxybutyrate) depolymerase